MAHLQQSRNNTGLINNINDGNAAVQCSTCYLLLVVMLQVKTVFMSSQNVCCEKGILIIGLWGDKRSVTKHIVIGWKKIFIVLF